MSNNPRKPRRSTQKPATAKTKNWTLPAVLGLTVSVVGAVGVIELRPQLAMSPQGQLATTQPFTAPFELTNAGYLGVHVENVIVILIGP
jgi:hypothetical protein